MECSRARALCEQAFVERTPRALEQVRDHLASCEACRSFHERLFAADAELARAVGASKRALSPGERELLLAAVLPSQEKPRRLPRLLLQLVHAQDLPGARDPDGGASALRGLERLERKLDLVLHLLTRLPAATAPELGVRSLRLRADGLDWSGPEPSGERPREGPGLVVLGLGPSCPLPLRLPARLLAPDRDSLAARWADMPDDIAESWSQWLFRQHRRALHARREGPGRETPAKD